MIKQFPEIVNFFQQDTFTDDDLIHLKEKIKLEYRDSKIYKQACTLIDLFLIKFQLSSPAELKRFKNQQKTVKSNNKALVSNVQANRKVAQSKKVKLVKKSTSSEKTVKPSIDISCYKKLSVSEICQRLNFSLEIINRCLIKNQIKTLKKADIVLSEEQFKGLSDMFISRLNALERKNKKERKIIGKTHSKNSTHEFKGVYGEIQRRGGVGKMIYIRKK